jgi:hypothetical protein
VARNYLGEKDKVGILNCCQQGVNNLRELLLFVNKLMSQAQQQEKEIEIVD